MDLAAAAALSRDPLIYSTVQQLLNPSAAPAMADISDHSNSNQLIKAATSSALSASQALPKTTSASKIAVDVKDLGYAYLFLADMPGVSFSNIKVQIENGNVLCISGERKPNELETMIENEYISQVKYLRQERGSGKFLRKFTLPSNAKLEHIQARCADGVLSVIIPKTPPPQPRTIDVVKLIT